MHHINRMENWFLAFYYGNRSIINSVFFRFNNRKMLCGLTDRKWLVLVWSDLASGYGYVTKQLFWTYNLYEHSNLDCKLPS